MKPPEQPVVISPERRLFINKSLIEIGIFPMIQRARTLPDVVALRQELPQLEQLFLDQGLEFDEAAYLIALLEKAIDGAKKRVIKAQIRLVLDMFSRLSRPPDPSVMSRVEQTALREFSLMSESVIDPSMAGFALDGYVEDGILSLLRVEVDNDSYQQLRYDYLNLSAYEGRQAVPRVSDDFITLPGLSQFRKRSEIMARSKSESFVRGSRDLPGAVSFQEKSRALNDLLRTTGRNDNDDCSVISLAFACRLALGIEFKKEDFSRGVGGSQGLSLSGSTALYDFYKNFNVDDEGMRFTQSAVEIKSELIRHGSGSIAFVLPYYLNRSGHFVVAVNVSGDILVIDNSMEGVWMKTWEDFIKQYFPNADGDQLSSGHDRLNFAFFRDKISPKILGEEKERT